MKKLKFFNCPDDPSFWMAVTYFMFVGLYAWYVLMPER